eukprot:11585070-Alexandrium_andersonii.AAC.1
MVPTLRPQVVTRVHMLTMPTGAIPIVVMTRYFGRAWNSARYSRMDRSLGHVGKGRNCTRTRNFAKHGGREAVEIFLKEWALE